MNITKDKKLRKDFFWNTIGSTFSSFNSLFFLIIVTRINGIDDAGIFTFGFSTACLFYIIGVYSGRVFQVTEKDKSNDDISYFNLHIISTSIMILITIIFCIFRKYAFFKISIILLLVIYKAIEAIS